MPLEILGKRLRWLRDKKRLAQKEVAAEIGMTLNAYQKYESGERDPKLEVLIKLTKLFETSADFLLGLKDITPTYDGIMDKYDSLRKDIDETNMQINVYTSRGYDLMERVKDVKESSPNYLTEDRMEVRKLEEQLAVVKEKKMQLEFDNHKAVSAYFNLISEYFMYIIEIPGVDLENDKIMSELMPIEITVSDGYQSNFAVTIKGKNGLYHSIDNFKTKEDAEKEKERIENLIKH